MHNYRNILKENLENFDKEIVSYEDFHEIFFIYLFFFMDFILEENVHGLALKFSQNHGNLENYKHGTVK